MWEKGESNLSLLALFGFLFTSFFLLSGWTFGHDCDLKSTVISDFSIYNFVCTHCINTLSKICPNVVIDNKLTIFWRENVVWNFSDVRSQRTVIMGIELAADLTMSSNIRGNCLACLLCGRDLNPFGYGDGHPPCFEFRTGSAAEQLLVFLGMGSTTCLVIIWKTTW
jgi:hypothetical protein